MVRTYFIGPIVGVVATILVVCLMMVRRKAHIAWLKSFPPKWQWLWGAWLPEDELDRGMIIGGVMMLLFCLIGLGIYVAELVGAIQVPGTPR